MNKAPMPTMPMPAALITTDFIIDHFFDSLALGKSSEPWPGVFGGSASFEVGVSVGRYDGTNVGSNDGLIVGRKVGSNVGFEVGGEIVGALVGCFVRGSLITGAFMELGIKDGVNVRLSVLDVPLSISEGS